MLQQPTGSAAETVCRAAALKGVKHCGLRGHDRRVGGGPRARAPSAEVPCAGGGGGGRATDQAPETRGPNAAQSVVPGG